MSVKLRDLIQYLSENGFYVVREGGNHTIYSNGNVIDLRNSFRKSPFEKGGFRGIFN